MPIDVECPNPDCGCRMQFEDAPADGEVTCPACGEKIQVAEAEGAPEDAASLEEQYRQAEDMAEQTVLDLEPVQVPIPPPPPTEAVSAEPVESAETDLDKPQDSPEDRPIDQWVEETAEPPANGAIASRVERKRELPPVLIVSAFSCSLLIVLIIAKWYIQTGRWRGDRPESPPPAVQQQQQQEPESTGDKASVDGWGSEDEIAKKLGKKLEEWEKSRPDPSFVTVSKNGKANFKTICEALMVVQDGGIVEIQDNRIYDEGNIGSWNSEDPEERRVNRKHNVTIRVANGQRAGIRWPADKELENYSNFLLCIGADWKIRNLIFVGHKSKKVSGISSFYGGLDIRGCSFTHLRFAISRGSYHEETEIRDCVFDDVYAVMTISESSEIPHVVFHNNVVRNASCAFTVYHRRDAKGTPGLLAFSIYDSIFVGVGELLRGYTMPKQMDLRCNYNCFWKVAQPEAPAQQTQSNQPMAPNVLAAHLAKLQKARRCDSRSIEADPLLNKRNYHLATNSPCLGKGRKGADMGVNWSRVLAKGESRPAPAAAPRGGDGQEKAGKTSGM